jgi:uncharacterized SAM-binding protein YcdF (DUF218 family)
MFFVLSKILSFLFTPLVWIIGLFIYAFITKVEKRRWRAFKASLFLLLFLSNTAIYNLFMHGWEIEAVKPSDLEGTFDAGILLGGFSNYDPTMQKLQFNRSGDRMMQTLDLYQQGKIKKIVVVSGSGSLMHQEYKEAALVHTYLLGLGIPDSNIILETESKNTYENAVNVKPILEKHFKKGRYVLITSAFHMRRALGCFKTAGIEVTPYSTDRMSGPWRWDIDFLLIPKIEVMASWDILLHEWMGMIMYKLAGYC